jgi:CDP-glucose 4,6-dehydratase
MGLGQGALEGLVMTGGTAMNKDFWRGRRVFVTGATGLVGGWLVKALLAQQADVVALVRDWVPNSELVRSGDLERVTVVRGDVRDMGCLETALGEYEAETVIHLAAQTIVGIANANPLSTWQTNVAGTYNLLEACRRSPRVKQVVVASSDKAYGDQEKLPYDESTPLQGRNPYDCSKSCADLISASYAKVYGLPVVVTRCGNFYGGGDLNWNRIVPGTMRSILQGESPIIRSDGSFIRDYFYVEDGAAAYMALAEALAQRPELAGEAFNFSNEAQVTVLQLTERILKLAGRLDLAPTVLGQANHEIRHQYLSAEKAHRVLGWSPRFTLDQGLACTWDWYRAYFGGRA